MHAIDDWLAEHRPADVHTYQTGAAPIVYDTTDSIKTSVDRTIWVTVGLVVIMLLLVYRSPVSPLDPAVGGDGGLSDHARDRGVYGCALP